MKEADPEHANGWQELGDFAGFLVRNGRLSRTARDSVSETGHVDSGVYVNKYFEFDMDAQSVVVCGERVHLTKLNCELLRYLVLRKNKVAERTELVEKVWGGHASVGTVNVHIARLRKILNGGRKDAPEIIRTQRNVGYMLVDEQAA